jgi:hypothetical protein
MSSSWLHQHRDEHRDHQDRDHARQQMRSTRVAPAEDNHALERDGDREQQPMHGVDARGRERLDELEHEV